LVVYLDVSGLDSCVWPSVVIIMIYMYFRIFLGLTVVQVLGLIVMQVAGILDKALGQMVLRDYHLRDHSAGYPIGTTLLGSW